MPGLRRTLPSLSDMQVSSMNIIRITFILRLADTTTYICICVQPRLALPHRKLNVGKKGWVVQYGGRKYNEYNEYK